MPDPEIRIEQLTGLRAILAPGRAERPDAFDPHPAKARDDAREKCPFCEGREDRTPPEVWANRPGGGEPDSPGWTARSVPNLYPVLGAEAGREPAMGTEQLTSGFAASIDPLASSSRGSTELFRSEPATGSHEVIISATEHVVSLAELDPQTLAGAVDAWRERMRAHADSPYLHLIVNEGPLAGGSLEHTHAQLYALDFVPPEVARERERTVAYHERTMGGHLLEDVTAEEIRRRERLVAVDDEAVLIAPWASRSPFHLRLIPRVPAARFADSAGGAAMLGMALRALTGALGGTPQLNLWIRNAPRGTEEFCWHLEILPRLTVRAGFELGTGIDINTYQPERAASDLRDALT